MMADQIEGFVYKLIKETELKKLNWQSLNNCISKKEILKEIDNGHGGFDPGVNSIREGKSYYLQSGEGGVFVFEIYHGDPGVTSPSMDTVALMVKINNILPLDNLTNYTSTEQQVELTKLKLTIENYLEEKYVYPDALYEFFRQVFEN